MREEWEVEDRKAASRIGLANLTSTTTDSTPSTDDNKKQSNTTASSTAAKPAPVQQGSHRDDAPIVMSEPIVTTSPSLVLEQQLSPTVPQYLPSHTTKFTLLAALITAGAWDDVQRLVTHMAVLNPVSHPVVSGALCGVVER